MMKFASVIQEAVYLALLPIQGCRVYDYVPETASLPYIKIGDDSFQDMECKTDSLYIANVTVEAFSDSKGYSELKNLSDTIIEKLSVIDFVKENCSVRFLGLDDVSFTRDDEFRQATITVRFIVA